MKWNNSIPVDSPLVPTTIFLHIYLQVRTGILLSHMHKTVPYNFQPYFDLIWFELKCCYFVLFSAPGLRLGWNKIWQMSVRDSMIEVWRLKLTLVGWMLNSIGVCSSSYFIVAEPHPDRKWLLNNSFVGFHRVYKVLDLKPPWFGGALVVYTIAMLGVSGSSPSSD